MNAAPEAAEQGGAAPGQGRLPALTVAALGVVFGDIGTNPLYALRQCFQDAPALAHDSGAVIGLVSLFIWSLILVVCVKYLGFVMRATHEGEGGTLALLGLLRRKHGLDMATPGGLTLLVLFGSALLYGDGAVTPAISVLSAMEGLEIGTKALQPVVVPLSVLILLGLFMVQSRGTERVGRWFGPVMAVWFVVIGVLGVMGLLARPGILAAFNPLHGLAFLGSHGWTGYASLGSVVLSFAGAEALYADVGHFGARPIRLGWYGMVFPCLLLNYLGQGALVLGDAGAGDSPFFGLVPHWGLYPMVLLSTLATVIASQALISGTFSLTGQSVTMGLSPRYRVIHTSAADRGQVYVPLVNAMLAVACIGLVLGFRSSARLGGAYGLAVIGTMTITSLVFYRVMREVFGWSRLRAVPLIALFLVVELAFLGANLAKILSGAWVPLAIGGLVFGVLATWVDGRSRYRAALDDWAMPMARFVRLAKEWKSRDAATAVLLSWNPDSVPLVGRHAWLRGTLRSERVVVARVETAATPIVSEANRLSLTDSGAGVFQAVVRFGFMQVPDLAAALKRHLPKDWAAPVFYLPQPIVTARGRFLSRLRGRVFLFLGSTGQSLVEYFVVPPAQAISVGLELDI